MTQNLSPLGRNGPPGSRNNNNQNNNNNNNNKNYNFDQYGNPPPPHQFWNNNHNNHQPPYGYHYPPNQYYPPNYGWGHPPPPLYANNNNNRFMYNGIGFPDQAAFQQYMYLLEKHNNNLNGENNNENNNNNNNNNFNNNNQEFYSPYRGIVNYGSPQVAQKMFDGIGSAGRNRQNINNNNPNINNDGFFAKILGFCIGHKKEELNVSMNKLLHAAIVHLLYCIVSLFLQHSWSPFFTFWPEMFSASTSPQNASPKMNVIVYLMIVPGLCYGIKTHLDSMVSGGNIPTSIFYQFTLAMIFTLVNFSPSYAAVVEQNAIEAYQLRNAHHQNNNNFQNINNRFSSSSSSNFYSYSGDQKGGDGSFKNSYYNYYSSAESNTNDNGNNGSSSGGVFYIFFSTLQNFFGSMLDSIYSLVVNVVTISSAAGIAEWLHVLCFWSFTVLLLIAFWKIKIAV
jgi:hypothetical protein